MTDSPLSRRQFFGATATVAAVGALPTVAAEAKPSPLAPEPPMPAGVCQRLGSARFRELTSGFQFSPDSKWLAQFDGRNFIGYEVATGRRAKWTLPHDNLTLDQLHWQMTTGGEVLAVQLLGQERPIFHLDLATGRERKGKVVAFAHGQTFTADGTGLIQYEDAGKLYRLDVLTGKTVWSRKWKCDASVPPEPVMVSAGWLVAVGVKRLHLFDPLTGKDGPKLEDVLPKDAPPDNHFTLIGFSADGKRVCGFHTAEGPEQLAERLVVWDLTTGKVVGRITPPEGLPNCALTADGQHLLTTDDTGRLVGVSVRTGQVTRKLAAQNVREVALSPDGIVLAVGGAKWEAFAGFVSEGVVRLLNPATGELLPQSPDPSAELTTVRFADKHTVVAEVNTDGISHTHLVWDTRTGRRQTRTPPKVQLPFLGGGFDGGFGFQPSELSPDGTRFVTEVSGSVIVTDAVTRRRLHSFPTHDFGFGFTPFWIGRGRLGQMKAGELLWWDLTDRTRHSIPIKVPAEGLVQSTAATPDGRTVALLHWDQNEENPTPTVAWIDFPSGKVSTTRGEFGELSISADGGRVAVVEAEERVRVTVIDRGGRRVTLGQPVGLNHLDPRVGLSPCGRTVFLSHARQDDPEAHPYPVVQFWEVLSGELLAEFGTPFAADGLGVSPCGRRVATTHCDAPIYLWDVFGETSDPQAKPDATTWAALDGTTDTAFTAIRRLVQHPAVAVDLLSMKLTPAEAPKAEWVKARLDKLGSADFRTRHTADLELSAVADRIAEPLRKAITAGADSPEADERLTALLAKAEGIPRSTWRMVRAVEALEYCDVPDAVVLLKKLAGGVDTAVLTREAKAAVKRRGERPA